jgi:hypothetical protein
MYESVSRLLYLGGSLKAKGFGDGQYEKSHPQASLEAATLLNY